MVVHRGDLHEPLLRACRDARQSDLIAGTSVTGYTQNAAQVTVTTRDGGRFTGDVLIGADGIRFVIRAQVVGDGEPRASGHTIYRSVIPMTSVPEDLRWN
ncbi:hypothetical protein [Frankia sp. CiP3]|uniref:hypothetical protein n=1 Tax=Frankia sp. CiP3 TaxID=2880971 RepID=UPI001EF6FD8E|nr:hypothetical protein [Frankia sp. CiP3]